MIALDRKYDDIKDLSQEEIEILIAQDGVFVEKKNDDGKLYFNDNFKLLSGKTSSKNRRKEYLDKKNKQIKLLRNLAEALDMNIYRLRVLLYKSVKHGESSFNYEIINGKYMLLPTPEEQNALIELRHKYPSEFKLVNHLNPIEALDIAKLYFFASDLPEYKKINPYQAKKVRDHFEYKRVNGFYYLKRSDKEKIKQYILQQRWG